jgi:aconitate hydratase
MADNTFGGRADLKVGDRTVEIFRLDALADEFDVARLPYSLKILLENLLRTEDGVSVGPDQVRALAGWDAEAAPSEEIAFTPARVLMQDFTGVPAIVDLAAMRDAMAELGGDPRKVNPQVPAELVIDHSIQVDVAGIADAFLRNAEIEFNRNRERYQFLRWGQTAFHDLRVVPPNTGIVHQVNLEHLGRVIFTNDAGQAYPDTLVGTDSHTPMINGLGVLGWGVGGIEAEAALLGQPVSMLIPQVVGFRLTGALPEGATATDMVLTVTEMLRRHGVVGKFVEFYGDGVANVSVANRATIGNMSPEYGSTVSIFPVDDATLRYLELTGRPRELIELVEAYTKEQGLFHDPAAEPAYSQTLELDLSTVEPSLAGPSRPQDRVAVRQAKSQFAFSLGKFLPQHLPFSDDTLPAGVQEASADEAVLETFPASDPVAINTRDNTSGLPEPAPGTLTPDRATRPRANVPVSLADGRQFTLDHGHVVIAAITSCTNTSNPTVMIAAGLLAKNAVDRGLDTKPWVKASLAPGSKVVTDYYDAAGLTPYLEKLRFNLVGYGCTTCIGNSGPLDPEISSAIDENDLAVVSVLSGNRNFEGRIHPDVRMNYLASPPLVVAYALAGTMDIDLLGDPLGTDLSGNPVYLRDLWPSSQDVDAMIAESLSDVLFTRAYEDVFAGDEHWNSLEIPAGERFEWQDDSTYVRRAPFFDGMPADPPPLSDITGARVIALLGDSVTTDHISPAGAIKLQSPAGQYLVERGVEPRDFNSYGSRRGNHEVMMRGTFANVRLRNRLAPGTEGGFTIKLPSPGASAADGAEQTTIYDAAVRYAEEGTPLVILAGKEYGSGSSRDWAAKGPRMLGVRAVIAESYERIHRSNLIGMGVLPLQFPPDTNAESLGLTGHEVFDITGLAGDDAAGSMPRSVHVRAGDIEFEATVRIDTPKEAEYYRHGGILTYVLRQLRDA